MRRLVKVARRLDIKVKGFFILGYPGETKEQMRRTVNFAARLGLDWGLFFIATPIPGSDLEKECRQRGYLIDENLDYVKQFYVSNIRTKDFEPAYVENLRQKVNFEINFKNNINLKLGRYDRAIEDIGEVARLYPHLDFVHFYLGVAYEKKGLKKQALQKFEKVLELNPDYKEARIRLKKLIQKGKIK